MERPQVYAGRFNQPAAANRGAIQAKKKAWRRIARPKSVSLPSPFQRLPERENGFYLSVGSEPSLGAPVPDEPMNTFLPSRKVMSRPLALQVAVWVTGLSRQRLSLA